MTNMSGCKLIGSDSLGFQSFLASGAWEASRLED